MQLVHAPPKGQTLSTHTIAMVMFPGVADNVLAPSDRARLAAAGELVGDDSFGSPDEIPDDAAADVTILLTGWGCPPLDDQVLARFPNLRLVAHAAGTVKSMVTPSLYAAGVAVTSAADANAVPVAEFTIAAIIMAGKNVFAIRDQHRANQGGAMAALPGLLDRNANMGNCGRTIGLVGASRVGRMVAEGLVHFDCRVVIHDPYLADDDAAALGAELATLDELCERCDIVSVHAPLLPSTERMIGAEQLVLMRDGTWIINTARGAIIDTDAMTAEAESGRLNLFIDTTEPEPLPADSPLYSLPNVVLTPHVAGSLGNELPRLGAAAVTEIERFVAGQPALCPVVESDLERIA
ncbi:hydroxyacid dehydrogenase [Ilumatobacter nonamiensis]|uniref:hydroxyacid dehydrogenase n=1 Tax=Ilumatobacter nonamiensis TaxID=467093 RepID=UPI0006871945|nr:hydroxyacid dehydrogenase [Ilumatobacter nonamiensis]